MTDTETAQVQQIRERLKTMPACDFEVKLLLDFLARQQAEIDRLRGERDDHRAVASQLRQRGEELQADVDLLRGQRDQELQRRQSAESSLSALREALKPIAAELRHAYSHAVNGRIGNQLAFGRGLLGPQIEKLEGLASPKPEDR